ncbi:MAG: TIGR04086 family membrane protein [Defluviitaleaceae bacterium]|nr:TIGR04086 family membrane protein [Defluviitaleaceae bacterium]
MLKSNVKAKPERLTALDDVGSRVGALMSGTLVAFAITCIVLIGYAMLITYSTFTGEGLPIIVTITCLAAVIVAGFDAAKGAPSKGWLWGMMAGAIYAVILVAIGTWVNRGFDMDTRTLTLIVLSVAGGGLGGVLGINLKR